MDSVTTLFRDGVMAMATYSPIEPPDQIARRLGLPEADIIKLDANENPYGVAASVLEELGRARYLSIYPDPAQKAVRADIAGYVGCRPENIVAGAGADELIDLLCRLVLNPGDKVLTFTPTFSYYKHVVELNGGEMIEVVREDDYSIDVGKLAAIDLNGVKAVLLCSPNNPPGNLLEREVLDFFLARDLLVVVDEAYFEFARTTFAGLIEEHDNLIVLRTFSKCFGLAGLRVGYGIMGAELQEAIMKIKPPYSVNMAAEVALRVCIDKREFFADQVDRMIATRDAVYERLAARDDLEVYPTHSNFILFRLKDCSAQRVRDDLEKEGILLRYFNTPLLKNHLRVSVGTEPQMEKFLERFFALLDG